MNSVLSLAIDRTAKRLGLTPEYTYLIYKSYWKYIRSSIESLNLDSATKERFEELSTNFNLPLIGKLYTKYEKIEKYNNKIKYIKEHVKDTGNKTNVQSSTGD